LSAGDPRSGTPSKTVRPGDDFHRHFSEGRQHCVVTLVELEA